MKVLVTAASLLLVTGAAQAQTATSPATTPVQQPAPTSSVTRDLNSGPPAPATYLAPAPAPRPAAPTTTAPAALSTPAPTASPPANQSRAATPAATPPSASPPRTSPPTATPAPGAAAPASPAPTPPAASSAAPTTAPAPRAATPAPTTPPASTAPAPRAPAATTSAPVASPAPTPAPPPPSASALTVLDASARAALPFTLDLPQGFELVTGRPGPDFRIYTVRRGDRSFAMIYAGPASQFPIYSGQMAEAGGRATVVVAEGSERHAVEHLFQRQTAPREIHVWTMSLEGADRALAERIAQSLDVR